MAADADLGDGQRVQQRAPAVGHHAQELRHQDEGEGGQEEEAQRLELQRGAAVEAGDVDEQVVLEVVLKNLSRMERGEQRF